MVYWNFTAIPLLNLSVSLTRFVMYSGLSCLFLQSGLIQGMMHVFFLSLSAHLTEQLGMAPGGEFRRAFVEVCVLEDYSSCYYCTYKYHFTSPLSPGRFFNLAIIRTVMKTVSVQATVLVWPQRVWFVIICSNKCSILLSLFDTLSIFTFESCLPLDCLPFNYSFLTMFTYFS